MRERTILKDTEKMNRRRESRTPHTADRPRRRELVSFLLLPDDVIGHVLSHLPLLDLVNARLVCTRLHYLVDGSSLSHSLWSAASLETVWPSAEILPVFERAAKHGNIQALIKLAVAYLYNDGVPDGSGKGTIYAVNGKKAAFYLKRAESLVRHRQPFSWVFIRPPFASTCVCCKACVCHNLKHHCMSPHLELIPSLFYVVGKAMSHYEHEIGEHQQSLQWFVEGSKHGCPYSSFEKWKSQLHYQDEVESVRQLRRIVASVNTFTDAQFELCKLYAEGHFGGTSRALAYQYIQQIVKTSPLILSDSIYNSQSDLTQDMTFILIDWVVEVCEIKKFSTRTLHLAINIIQRFLVARHLKRTQLQLLGVTALLLASRWTAVTIITIRECAWLTDSTYRYDEVVHMMGEIVALFGGEIQKPIIPDYLELYQTLVETDRKTAHLAAYLSETAILFSDFGRYTVAHLAASCLLLARILLEQELPWPSLLVEATGLSVLDLYQCTLLLYSKCLTEDSSIVDYRGVELCSIKTRYADQNFLSVSKIEFMDYHTMKERLGVLPSYCLRSSHGNHTSNDNSLVTQSFVNNFDAQTHLSDSSLLASPLPSSSQYSPRASIDSLAPSPIVFNASDLSYSSPVHEMNELPLRSSSPNDNSSSIQGCSLSYSLPVLSGIEPLHHSEDTVGVNTSMLSKNLASKKKIRHRWTPTKSDQENLSLAPTSPKGRQGSVRPLGSLTNFLRPSSARYRSICMEKRTFAGYNSEKITKRHRSTTNLL